MTGQVRLVPVPPSRERKIEPRPITIFGDVQGVWYAVKEVGELLESPNQATLGEIARRVGKLLRVCGVTK